MAITVPSKIKLICLSTPEFYNYCGQKNLGIAAIPVDFNCSQSIIDSICEVKNIHKYYIKEINNNGITNLKIIGSKYIGGALFYKVMNKSSIIFDIDIFTLAEGAIKNGIKKGGILQSKFIWIRDERAYVRLTVMDSSIHKAAKNYSTLK